MCSRRRQRRVTAGFGPWLVAVATLGGCDEPRALDLPGGAGESDDPGALVDPFLRSCDETGTLAGSANITSDAGLERIRGCRWITGTLTVSGALTRTGALAHIQRVGDLYVENSSLTTLAVFEDLRHVDGNVLIRNNGRLVDVSALDLLTFGEPIDFTIATVEISRNPALTVAPRFSGLATSPPRQVRIRDNQSLRELDLTEVDTWVGVEVWNNSRLERLALRGDVDASIFIEGNRALRSLHEVQVRSAAGLFVIDNLALESVGVHAELGELGELAVIGGTVLEDAGRFPSLESLDVLTLQKLPAGCDVDVLSPGVPVGEVWAEQLQLTGALPWRFEVQGSFRLLGAPSIRGFSDLRFEEDLTRFEVDTVGLASVDDLPKLTAAGALTVRNNPLLDALAVIDWCATVQTETPATCGPNGGNDGCPFFDDGTCDEPEGTGNCPDGTDPLDCGPFP